MQRDLTFSINLQTHTTNRNHGNRVSLINQDKLEYLFYYQSIPKYDTHNRLSMPTRQNSLVKALSILNVNDRLAFVTSISFNLTLAETAIYLNKSYGYAAYHFYSARHILNKAIASKKIYYVE